MNEQIKALMGKTLDDKFSETWTTMTHQDLEKFSEAFAESIIRDCIGVALNELVDEELINSGKYDDSDMSYLSGNNGGVVDAVYAIKQHFGVDHE
jgi:hypothetical protein